MAILKLKLAYGLFCSEMATGGHRIGSPRVFFVLSLYFLVALGWSFMKEASTTPRTSSVQTFVETIVERHQIANISKESSSQTKHLDERVAKVVENGKSMGAHDVAKLQSPKNMDDTKNQLKIKAAQHARYGEWKEAAIHYKELGQMDPKFLIFSKTATLNERESRQ